MFFRRPSSEVVLSQAVGEPSSLRLAAVAALDADRASMAPRIGPLPGVRSHQGTQTSKARSLGARFTREDLRHSAHGLGLRGLTFEVRRGRRRSAGPAGRMISTTWRRARCFAVGPRLDRGVRPRVVSGTCQGLEVLKLGARPVTTPILRTGFRDLGLDPKGRLLERRS